MSDQAKVLVTRRIPQAGIDVLEAKFGSVDIGADDRSPTRDELLEFIKGRQGIITLLSESVDAEFFDAAGDGLKIVANYAVGYNNINVEEATKRGIVVANTPGVLTGTTADLAWSLIMSASRRVFEGDRLVRSGGWKGWAPMQLLGVDIHGATLGIIGAGRIGAAVAMRSTGFDMKVLYTDERQNAEIEKATGAKKVDLDTLLKESDIISIHVPLLESTKGLIGEREFGLMKNSAVLVNTSRGPVIQEAELVKALKSGQIFAAGLDVYENEPALEPGLADLDNVVMLPHLGSASEATRDAMARLAAEAVVKVIEGGCPSNAVNPDVCKG